MTAAASAPTSSARLSKRWRSSARSRTDLMSSTRPRPRKTSARIELQQRGAGANFGKRGRAAIDAADADQREHVFDSHIGFRQHARRQRQQRAAGQAPGLACALLLTQARRTRHRRVADDHAVDAARARDTDHIVELGERKIGRDLQQHRRGPRVRRHALARIDDARRADRRGLWPAADRASPACSARRC